MAVLAALPRYVDKGAPFEAFVYRVTANKVADAQRGVMRGPTPTDELPDQQDQSPTPEEFALRTDEAAQLDSYLSKLTDQQREIITLRVAVGLSAEETAAALDMSAGAVRVAQHRALTRLRELIAQDGGLT